MPWPRPRISLATVMMLVITAATASALYAQVYRLLDKQGSTATTVPTPLPAPSATPTPAPKPTPTPIPLDYDYPAVFVGAIILTGLALAARKGHSGALAMLQINLACLGFLSLISVAEWKAERPILYWYQATFAVMVVAPLIVRRRARRRLERGARRTRWLQTTDAIAFAFLNMLLVLAGLGIQTAVAGTLGRILFN